MVLTPAFRFTVSRSIYKAIGRFLAERKDRKFICAAIAREKFCNQALKKRVSFELGAGDVPNLLPCLKNYIIFERSADELGFHKLGANHQHILM